MPNQRAPGTVILSVPISKITKDDLRKIADENGFDSLAELVRHKLTELVRRSKLAKKGSKK